MAAPLSSPVVTVLDVVCACLSLACAAEPSHEVVMAVADESKAPTPQIGTQQAPAVVELSAAPVVRVEAVDKTSRPVDFASAEWILAYCTAVLAAITAVLALATYRLYRATVSLGRDAKQNAADQTTRMERSITEANRAAVAMEAVATATNHNAQLMQSLLTKQMRAYVSVDLGQPLYEDANVVFQVSPVIVNNDLTPARNLSFKVRAGVFDWGNPTPDIVFPPVGDLIVNDIGIAPRQSFTINAMINRMPDADAAEIMRGVTRRLFAWGRVTYDDVYGGSWETNFCFNYAFPKGLDEKVRVQGFYYPHHNNAT